MTPFISAIILTPFLLLSALVQKQQTDREADGLKGPVNTVVTEVATFRTDSGKLVEFDLKPESEVTYDADGNRIRRKGYDYTGVLFESVNYSRIDGDKVAIYGDVDNKNRIVVEMPAPANQPKRRSDSRYTYKFKYKYDSYGNVSEESWHQNDGSLWLKYTYKVKGNRKQEFVYSADGSLNQMYTYTLDDKGNEVELLIYDTEKKSVESKETYKYEAFDSKGNWTKRITSKGERKQLFLEAIESNIPADYILLT